MFTVGANGNLTITSCGKDASGNSTGTIDNASQYQGGLIYGNSSTSILNIYNITVDASAHTYDGSSYYGGAIHSKGTFNLYSGTIIGSAQTTNANRGGSVTVASNSVMNMYGGTICDGMSKKNTGNVYVSGTLNMMGGTITGGVFGDDSTHRAANMYISATGTLNMTGGTIDGHVYAGVAGATVKLSGDAKIASDTRSLWVVPGNTKLMIGDLTDKAQIRMNILTSDNNWTYGVFAKAMDSYTITEQDVSRLEATDSSAAKNGNVILNSDNTLSVEKLN